MTDGVANDGTVDRAADTMAEAATENRSEALDSVIDAGLLICEALDVLCMLGTAIPGVSGACTVAREILEKVRSYKAKSDELQAVGVRVVKLLKMIQKFQNQAEKLTDRQDMEKRIAGLYGLLERLNKRVKACGEQGFMASLIGCNREVEGLSKVEKEIGEEMQDIRDIFAIDTFAGVKEISMEMKALRAELSAATLTEEVQESANSNTMAGDQTPLYQVFEMVMRDYEDEAAELKAVDVLDAFLYKHKATIKKDESIAPECDGRRVKRLCTPMHVACALGKFHLALCLSVKGFDINQEDQSSRLPFHYAARHGHKKIVEWIIKLHEKRLHKGSTPQTLEELLKAEETRGRTALDLAVLAKQAEVVGVLTKCLIKNGLSSTINVNSTELPSSGLVS